MFVDTRMDRRIAILVVVFVVAIVSIAVSSTEAFLPGPGRDAALKCYTINENGENVMDCYWNPPPPPMTFPSLRRDPRGALASEGPPLAIILPLATRNPTSDPPFAELRDANDRPIPLTTIAPPPSGTAALSGTAAQSMMPIGESVNYTAFTKSTLAPAPTAHALDIAPPPPPPPPPTLAPTVLTGAPISTTSAPDTFTSPLPLPTAA
jgi:hypothetical protein